MRQDNILDVKPSGNQPVESPQHEKDSSSEHASSYRVILHNDDHNARDYVADTILKITALKPFESHRKMMEADQAGSACLLVTSKEKAASYRDRFISKGLTVTIEPVD